MDFGKVANVDRLRFVLPEDSARSLDVLARAKAPGRPRVYIGAPIWSCKEWVGKLYPPKTPARDYLKLYSRQMNSIELNSTFYRFPDARMMEGWKEAVPSAFRFAPKVTQAISHDDLGAPPRQLDRFLNEVSALGDRLGMSFLQLPPQFGPESFGTLSRLVGEAEGRPLAVEFRHPAWFTPRGLIDRAVDLLEQAGVSTVITDVAGRRDVLHPSLTTPRVLIRFVGNELHPSDFTRLDAWTERLKRWFEAGLQEVYFFMHHPTYVHVPELVNALVERLNSRCGLGLQGWAAPRPAEREQLKLL